MYKVYLLDDEFFILEGLKCILPWEEYGFEIVGSASNGKDGFEEIIKMDIDLIVTDIMMPKMTGLELMSQLKGINYETNFIVLSAFEEFSYAKQAMNMGAENYLLKPVDIEELSENLKSINKKLKKKEKENIDNKVLKNDLLLNLVSGDFSDTKVKDLSNLGVNIDG
ncbi:MAG: response regulator, partial [Peptostreptococcaceae bacterium]